MTRQDFETYIAENYPTEIDHPWADSPNFTVFRHPENRKWFALIMNIAPHHLNLTGNDKIDVVNLKIDPDLIEELVHNDPNIFPAYHMNKTHWITVKLDTISDNKLKWLVDLSFAATIPKRKNRHG